MFSHVSCLKKNSTPVLPQPFTHVYLRLNHTTRTSWEIGALQSPENRNEIKSSTSEPNSIFNLTTTYKPLYGKRHLSICKIKMTKDNIITHQIQVLWRLHHIFYLLQQRRWKIIHNKKKLQTLASIKTNSIDQGSLQPPKVGPSHNLITFITKFHVSFSPFSEATGSTRVWLCTFFDWFVTTTQYTIFY